MERKERKTPQDYHPDLTEERLILVAQAIAQGRANAVMHHIPEIGDTGWTLGSRGFGCCRKAIEDLANIESWLQIEDSSLHFVFKIGSATVRFYRGEPDKPNRRTLRRVNSEILQESFLFAEEDDDVIFRIAVDTDIEGYADSIYLVCFRGETVVQCWSIPYKEDAVSIPVVLEDIAKSAGVEVPPAPIGIPGEKKKQDNAS
ncbi:hypothetical protein SRCM100623_02333 [Acetobacter pasteurianus]|uniref:Uncharacterized protein n=1 Tax=Acetobacter pasteurianus TaxID=438 RepID=A0A1A0D369_ACEPA|nr:hypothetical protein [Acetobacter pasteurianus]OAZ69027.1 hypothetical protein SRCM100623_02333 [Acetobacter pasteurianus]